MEFLAEYDFVVFGEHPAGLWVARHLHSIGSKVLVLPLGVERGENLLPRSVAEEFGWTEGIDDRRARDPLQILLPDRRIRVHPSRSEFEDEVRFQLGEDCFQEPLKMKGLLRGMAYFARGGETGPVLPGEYPIWRERLFATVASERERGYFVRSMLEELKHRGAHVAGPRLLKQVFIERNLMVGIQLQGQSRMIPVRQGWISVPMDHLNSYFSAPAPMVTNPLGWRFEMSFNCSAEVLPSGISSRMIYVEADSPILEILRESEGRFRMATQLPLRSETLDRGFQRRLCERMMKVAGAYIVDLEYNLKGADPDLRDPERVEKEDLPAQFPFETLEQIPWSRITYGADRRTGFLTPYANLYRVNEESDSSQGIHGAFGCAAGSLEHLAKRQQDQKFFKPFANEGVRP